MSERPIDEANSVVGYMCATDWYYELGYATGGNRVYASIEDLKSDRPCVEECGIVEVEVRLIKDITKATH